MIVRDEQQNLSECLPGIARLFDEIIVVDTGSTDATKEVARKHGATVVHFPWKDDFSAARNETPRHATGDYIFWLDADDRIDADNAKRLRTLFASLDGGLQGYMMTTVCSLPHRGSEPLNLSHLRLFRASPEVGWRHRIHEQILSSVQQLGYGIFETEIAIHHTGYKGSALWHRKLNRDLRLCRLEYAESPRNPVVLFNFGITFLRLGDFSGGLETVLTDLERFPERSDPAKVIDVVQ
jgi:glycosyltransferase involved in cell wall biosynthesis